MTYYQKYMGSASHLSVFKFVARCGFMPWLAIGTVAILLPWYCWALSHGYSKTTFGAGILALLVPGSFALVASTRYFPVAGGNVWMTVEVKRGVLALHMWKTFPSKAVLCQVAVEAVKIGLAMGFKEVRIESPLLVREGRLQLWGGALRNSLAVFGPQVVVTDVTPEKMFFLRAMLFAITRKISKYDEENKHLPKPEGLSCKTAGFVIHLP